MPHQDDVSPTIQEPERVSENNSPDTIEMLYIESSNIGLVEFKNRIETLITQYTNQKVLEARQSELEMFKKIPIQNMSKEVSEHITRRYTELKLALNEEIK